MLKQAASTEAFLLPIICWKLSHLFQLTNVGDIFCMCVYARECEKKAYTERRRETELENLPDESEPTKKKGNERTSPSS